MAKRILITGGSGYIGSHLSEFLWQQGYEVAHVSRNESVSRWQTFRWHVDLGTVDDRAFSDVETVINLAGASVGKPWTRRHRKEIVSSRIDSTRLLHDWLASHPHDVRNYIGVSATGAYGHRPGEVLTEESPAGKGFLGELSVAWEREHHRIAELGLRTVILRQGLVFGHEATILDAFMKPMRFGINPIVGNGRQHVPWILIDDLVGIMFYMISSNHLNGIYNAVAPQSITNRELCRELKAAYRRRTLPTWAPAFMLKLMLGERSEMVLADTQVSAARITGSGYAFKFPTFREAALEMARKSGRRS